MTWSQMALFSVIFRKHEQPGKSFRYFCNVLFLFLFLNKWGGGRGKGRSKRGKKGALMSSRKSNNWILSLKENKQTKPQINKENKQNQKQPHQNQTNHPKTKQNHNCAILFIHFSGLTIFTRFCLLKLLLPKPHPASRAPWQRWPRGSSRGSQLPVTSPGKCRQLPGIWQWVLHAASSLLSPSPACLCNHCSCLNESFVTQILLVALPEQGQMLPPNDS